MSFTPDPRFSSSGVSTSTPGVGTSSGVIPARPVVPRLLVFTALVSESEVLIGSGCVERGLVPPPGEVWRRTLASGRDVWVGYTGLGAESTTRAFAAITSLKAEGEAVRRRVVFAGLAGALRGDLAPGDLILLDGCTGEDGLHKETSRAFTDELATSLEKVGITVRRRGTSVEVARLAGDPEEKRVLARRFPEACIVDMEDRAAIDGARALGADVAVLRVVVDRLGDQVPDLGPGLDGAGRPRPLHLAAQLVKNPGTVLSLGRLARNFSAARATLDRALAVALQL